MSDLMQPDPSRPIATGKVKPYRYLVIDGGGMVVTAWTTQRSLERAEDRVRGAIYIFLTTLASLSGLIEPGASVVIAWDGRDNRAWRRGRHPWYKHGRGTVVNREEIRAVIAQLDGLLVAMGVATVKIDGREADDLAAAIATKASATTDVLVFSDDNDYRQLVNERVHLSRRSMDGIILTVGTAAVLNVPIGEFYLHQKAIMGDSGDNIKGLRQIGEAKALSLLACNPNIVHQCAADPASADWSNVEGALRKAFVRAGRRLVSPTDLQDPKFVAAFCKKRGLPMPTESYDVPDEVCLEAAAREIQWSLDLVTMDYDIEAVISFPKPNFEAIPRIINRLEMSEETDLYSSLYRIAGMTAPGTPVSWRATARAGAAIDSGPALEDKF
jgi:5'-3' exonuclease